MTLQKDRRCSRRIKIRFLSKKKPSEGGGWRTVPRAKSSPDKVDGWFSGKVDKTAAEEGKPATFPVCTLVLLLFLFMRSVESLLWGPSRSHSLRHSSTSPRELFFLDYSGFCFVLFCCLH